MALGNFAKKALGGALGVATEKIDAAMAFAEKLQSKDIDHDKGKEIVEKVSKMNSKELGELVNKVYDLIK